MRLLTSGSAPTMSFTSRAEGIARGRLLLIKSTHQDFGYNLKAWHDYLATTKAYAYRSRKKHGVYPDSILRSLDDPTWRDAVHIAESTSILERIQSEDRDYRAAVIRADLDWGGKNRQCPKCNTTFKSIQDRGQCPQCRFDFHASHPDGNPNWWREEMAEPSDGPESPTGRFFNG